ncbi:MAG TPA: hypothetical protein VN905_05415 [Candidatus Binatia bacterium]|nr:hypothetical protein [Candidatus Binatia bacterium]
MQAFFAKEALLVRDEEIEFDGCRANDRELQLGERILRGGRDARREREARDER